MTNNWDNVDIEAMQARHKKEKTKLSYAEWFAKQLVNSHMGDETAIVYKKSSDSSMVEPSAHNGKVEGSSPSPSTNTQKSEENTEDTHTQEGEEALAENMEKVKGALVSHAKAMGGVVVDVSGDQEAWCKNAGDKLSAHLNDTVDTSALGQLHTDLVTTGTHARLHTADKPEGERIDPGSLVQGSKSFNVPSYGELVLPVNLHDWVIINKDIGPELLIPEMFGFNGKSKYQQLQFCMEYIKDFNGARSVRDAGYSAKDQNTQSMQASRMLCKDNVMHCMQQLKQLRRERISRRPNAKELASSADAVVNRIAELASFDISDFMSVGTDGLPFYDFSDATAEQLRTIGGIKIEQGKKIEYEDGEPVEIPVWKVEIKDHLRASLDMLGKHHGIFKERIEIDDKRDMDVKDVSRRLAFLLNAAKAKK